MADLLALCAVLFCHFVGVAWGRRSGYRRALRDLTRGAAALSQQHLDAVREAAQKAVAQMEVPRG